MKKLYSKLLRPRVRAYLYAVSSAVLFLISIYGLVNQEQMLGWLSVFAALFAVAADNTPGDNEPNYDPRHAEKEN